jgi:hypothetical protein
VLREFLNNAPTGPSANAGEPALELIRRLVLRLLPHNLDNFVKLPGSEVVGVDSHIHRERVRRLWKTSVRMTVEVPRSAIGTVPDAQGIVTEHDRLDVDRNFSQIVEPGEFFSFSAKIRLVERECCSFGRLLPGQPSDMPNSWASVRMGVAQTFSYSSARVRRILVWLISRSYR